MLFPSLCSPLQLDYIKVNVASSVQIVLSEKFMKMRANRDLFLFLLMIFCSTSALATKFDEIKSLIEELKSQAVKGLQYRQTILVTFQCGLVTHTVADSYSDYFILQSAHAV